MSQLTESLSRHKSVSLCSHIHAIAQPLLENTPIEYFTKVRVYGNGRYAYVSSCDKWQDLFIHKGLEKISPFSASLSAISNQYYLYQPYMFPSIKKTDDLMMDFNMGNVFAMTEKHEKYCDVYLFVMNKETENQADFYFNNMDLLRTYILYFKDKAGELMKQLDRSRSLQLSGTAQEQELKDCVMPNDFKDVFLKEIKKFHSDSLLDDTYLTPREKDCFYWCAQGKTADETAEILHISKRTVEKHLEHVRQKTGCYKQTSLINHLARSDLSQVH